MAPRKTRKKPTTDGRHAKAIAVLARGGTRTAAAKAAGVHHSTVADWLKDPAHPVSVGLEEIAQTTVRHAERELRSATTSAVRALVDIARDPDQPPAARVSAAREILSRGGLSETTRQEVDVGNSAGIQAIREALSIGEDPDDIEAALEDGGSD